MFIDKIKMITNEVGYIPFDLTLSKADAARLDCISKDSGFQSPEEMIYAIVLNLCDPGPSDEKELILQFLSHYQNFFTRTIE